MLTRPFIRLFIREGDDLKSPSVRTACGNLASVTGMLCNLLLFVGKFGVGLLTGSIAIRADGINNLSDASSNIVSLIGFKLGSRPADEEHPYGHARYEYLAGLAVSVMILVIGIELARSSIEKILHPAVVKCTPVSILVLAVSILVKLWMADLNRTIGGMIQSDTLMATAADSRNDVITTSAVLLAQLLTAATGWVVLDGLFGLGVAVFILVSGVLLVRDTLSPLLGRRPDDTLVKHISDTIMGYDGVLGIHELMVHDYGPGQVFVSVHVEVQAEQDVLECHDLIDRIEQDFMKNDNLMLTIHYDPIVTADKRVNALRAAVAQAAGQIDPAITVHDLRMVPGNTHTNVIFDCVVPVGFTMGEKELCEAMTRLIQKTYPNHYCVVKLEHSFAGEPQGLQA